MASKFSSRPTDFEMQPRNLAFYFVCLNKTSPALCELVIIIERVIYEQLCLASWFV